MLTFRIDFELQSRTSVACLRTSELLQVLDSETTAFVRKTMGRAATTQAWTMWSLTNNSIRALRSDDTAMSENSFAQNTTAQKCKDITFSIAWL